MRARSLGVAVAVAVACGAIVVATKASATVALNVGALAWMAGHWRSCDATGACTEEVWLAPQDGVMLGLNRSWGGESGSFEYLRIETRADGSAWYVPAPNGRPAAEFLLRETSWNFAEFENTANPFPYLIRYQRSDDGQTLTATILGLVDGEERSISWTWQRVTDP